MKLQELYQRLLSEKEDSQLVIGEYSADGVYRKFLSSAREKSIVLYECKMELSKERLRVEGRCPWGRMGQAFGMARIVIVSREEGEEIRSQVELSFAGEGTFKECFGRIPEISKGTLEHCVLVCPVLKWEEEDYLREFPFSLSGMFCFRGNESWEELSFLKNRNLHMEGKLNYLDGRYESIDVKFRMLINAVQCIKTFLGEASVSVLLQMRKDEYCFDRKYKADVFLVLSVHMKTAGKQADFYRNLLSDSTRVGYSAVFPKGLGLGDISALFRDVFCIGEPIMLPEEAALNAFSLYEIHITEAKKDNLFHSLSGQTKAGRGLMVIAGLSRPWNLPVPGLSIEQMMVGWEMTWIDYDSVITTLHVALEARLRVGSYELRTTLDGQYPDMELTGNIRLSQEQITLKDLMDSFHVGAPEEWNTQEKVLAEAELYISVPNRMYSIKMDVNDVLSFRIGNLEICLSSIQAGAEFSPHGTSFYLSGTILLGEGENLFSLFLSAMYQNGWEFRGGLREGEINFVVLMGELFQIRQLSELSIRLALSELNVIYDMRTGIFEVTAAFSLDRFTIFGIGMELGGRVLLRKSEAELSASLLFYIQAGIFRFLVQMDDFYQESPQYLFRLEWNQSYIQAVYEKRESVEFVTVSMGGMTLGSLLESLIQLLNPNLKYHLPSPWNLLNQISLSRFLLRINVTEKTADFLYLVDKKIPGLMDIHEIGIRYADNRILFLLTGKLLDQTYTPEEPLTWDAVNEQPPANTADGEQKLTVYYVGLGYHLDMGEAGEQIRVPDVLQILKEKINGDRAAASYSETTGWMIGADFKLQDLFRLQVIFAEPVLYGANICVSASDQSPLAMFNGLEFELLYKKIGAKTGMFRAEFLMPERYRKFSLGIFEIQIGRICVEVYTNGSFYIDLGFPHGGDFSGSFGFSFSIYSGKGGIYFGALKGEAAKNVPEADNGSFSPVILLGVGLSVGLGRSFDFGIVKGGLSLMMTGIIEGVYAIFHKENSDEEAAYYKLSAVVGISGSVFLSVDFKIITVQANAALSVTCGLVLEAYRKSNVSLDVNLTVGASIKILFIKIRFSFTFHERIEFSFGEDTAAPWRLKTGTKTRSLENAGKVQKMFAKELFSGKNGRGEREIQDIRLYLTQCYSIQNLEQGDGSAPVYCTAFLLALPKEEFQKLADVVADLVFELMPDTFIREDDVKAVSAESFTYTFWEKLAKERLKFYISFAQEGEGEIEGVVFPMLPQLKICFGSAGQKKEVDFGGHLVDAAYMEQISEYFSKLNADISSAETFVNLEEGEEEKLPFCAALMSDWLQMLVKSILHKMESCFTEYDTQSEDIRELLDTYHISAEDVFAHNMDLEIEISEIPVYRYRIQSKDTWEAIERKWNLDAASLKAVWEDVNLLDPRAEIPDAELIFDNSQFGLTAYMCARLFWIRMHEEHSEATSKELVEVQTINEEMPAEWMCVVPGERIVYFPDGTKRPALTGDTLFRIAEEFALLEKNNDLFGEFYEKFLKENEADPQDVKGIFTIRESVSVNGDRCMRELYERLFPDGDLVRAERQLASYAILKTYAVVALQNVTVSYKGTVKGAVETGVCTWEELIRAAEAGCVHIMPQRVKLCRLFELPPEALRSSLKAEYEEIGAKLSRFFLQGLRIPDFSEDGVTEETFPLYQLSGQQQVLEDTEQDFHIELNKDPDALWIVLEEDSQIIPKEVLKERMPSGTMLRPENLTEIPDFTRVLESVRLTQTTPLLVQKEEKIFFSLSEQMQTILRQTVEEPEIDGDIRWGSLFAVKILRCDVPGFCRIYGAAAKDRQALRKICTLDVARIALLAESGALETESYLKEMDWEECILLKTNLSVETHMEPVRLRQSTQNWKYSAKLQETEIFLRMLWECSTVGGGGYYLCGGQSDLDEIAFDKDGSASLYIWIEFAQFCDAGGTMNCLLSEQICEELILTWQDRFQSVPVFPPGYKGVSFSLGTKQPEDDFSAQELESLFQTAGYKLCQGELHGSRDSAPVLPQKGADGLLQYRIGIPLYRFTDEETIYSAVGKRAKVMLEARDILGNRAALGAYELTGTYNDSLIAVHELPDTVVSYCIRMKNGLPSLCISINQMPREEAVEQEKRSLIIQAGLQYSCSDFRGHVACSVYPEAIFALSEEHLRCLWNYTDTWLRYADSETPVPASGEIELVLPVQENEQVIPQEILKLTSELILERAGENLENPNAVRAVSVLTPAMEDAREEESEFVREFETVFPMLHLAHSSEGNGFYILPVGENGFLSEVLIRPFEKEDGRICLYYARKPLALTSVSRKIQFDRQLYSYMQIDLEQWLWRFLADLESVLEPEKGKRVVGCRRETWESLVREKENMAESLSNRYCSLYDGSEQKEVSKAMADRLKRNLTEYYEISTIAVYQAGVKAAQDCRMTVQIAEREGLKVIGSKVSSESDLFCMFIAGQGRKKSYPIDFPVVPGELEYHIQTMQDGYEASDWLKLLNPARVAHFDLQSDVDIPIPWMHYPQNPSIPEQTYRTAEQLEYLLRWNYRSRCICDGREQNILYVHVVFRNQLQRKGAPQKDLFDVLAEYDISRNALWEELNKGSDEIFVAALEKMIRFSEEVRGCFENESLKVRQFGKEIYSQNRQEVELKITFSVDETVSAKAEISEETQKMFSELGLTLAQVSVLEESEDGSVLIEWGIDGLPLYEYGRVKTEVYVTQNESLLWDKRNNRFLPVYPGFVYQSQKSGSAELFVAAEYTRAFFAGEVLSAEEMAISIWDMLRMEEADIVVDIGISYVYFLAGKEIRVPAVYLPDASAGKEQLGFAASVDEMIRQWKETNGAFHPQQQWSFDVSVSSRRDNRLLLRAEILYRLANCDSDSF